MITFTRRKTDCLSKGDKSSIGGVDEPIRELCRKINSKDNLYTLSSCSGRAVLIKNLDKKQPNMFVLREHRKLKLQDLINILNESGAKKETLIFKQEPPILHVCCADIESAEKLLNLVRESGWKNSGIMTLGQGKRIVLELRSTEYLALPIMEKGKLLVGGDFLKILVRESNLRLERGWKKIEKLAIVV